MSESLTLWHFTEQKDVLRDGTPFALNEPLPTIADPVPCRRGYHGSPTVFDALQYAQGSHLYRRTLSGVILPHGKPIDKYVGSDAIATAYCDAEPLLRVFARQCAADVLHLWDAPQVVRDYLLTGDDKLRNAAWAAWDAAWDEYAAAWAAWDAARAARAAHAAAYAAARAEYAAARAASDERHAQRERLESWVIAFIERGELPTVTIPEGKQ